MQKNSKVLSGFMWRFLERFGAKGVELVVSVILARLISPEDYGTIAIVMVFTTILNVFIDSGLGNALVQKKNADNVDFSSVFYFNCAACLVLYGLIFLAAPLIAAFYQRPELVSLIRVLALTLVVSGVRNVQQAYVMRNLLFKKFFYSTLSGTIVAAAAGIFMAYQGYGVWALVAQQLLNAAINTVVLWITVKWRPCRAFSRNRLKGLLSYGWKLLVAALLDTLSIEIRQLIIGKFYSSESLAYYNQGEKYPKLLATNIKASIDSVLLPVMSGEQDNRKRVKAMTRRSIKVSMYLMTPVMCGMCATAAALVSLLLTDVWLPCVPYFQVFCVTFIFHPIHTANLNAIKALGRSDLFLKLEVIKKIAGVAVLLATVAFGPFVIACGGLLMTVISQVVNAWPNKKLLGYSYVEQLADILPTLLLSAAMCGAVLAIGRLPLSTAPLLAIQVVSGAAIYIAGSVLLKIDSFFYCRRIAVKLLRRGADRTKKSAPGT